MKGDGVEPEAIAGAAETVPLGGREKAAGRGLRASPFVHWIDGGPFVGDPTDG